MNTNKIAAEVAKRTRPRGYEWDELEFESVTSIIKSAIEKAREPLLDCISDARIVIERTISVMTEEQAGQVAGIRSWLEQAPYG